MSNMTPSNPERKDVYTCMSVRTYGRRCMPAFSISAWHTHSHTLTHASKHMHAHTRVYTRTCTHTLLTGMLIGSQCVC